MNTLKRFAIAAMSAALMLALAGIASAANYEVDTLSDTTSAGHCTLRDAISASQGAAIPTTSCNRNGDIINTIGFSPALTGGTIKLSSPLPLLFKGKLTIDGPAAAGIMIDATGISQDVLRSSTPGFGGLRLNNLGLSGGGGNAIYILSPVAPVPVTISNCTFSNFGESAIQNIGGILTITSSTFTANGGRFSAAIDSQRPPLQGAVSQTTINQSSFLNNNIAVSETGLALTISNSTFKGNNQAVNGSAAATTISNSLFSANQPRAFFNSHGAAEVSNCTFSDNGAGVVNNGIATTRIVGSTFTKNSSPAITNDGSGGGNAQVTIVNSTLVGNSGAIMNTNGVVGADFSTFSDNGAQTFYTYSNEGDVTVTALRGDMVSGSPGATNCYVPFPPNQYVDQGFNIFSDGSCPAGPRAETTPIPLGSRTMAGRR
jgi:hypothetical protein